MNECLMDECLMDNPTSRDPIQLSETSHSGLARAYQHATHISSLCRRERPQPCLIGTARDEKPLCGGTGAAKGAYRVIH